MQLIISIIKYHLQNITFSPLIVTLSRVILARCNRSWFRFRMARKTSLWIRTLLRMHQHYIIATVTCASFGFGYKYQWLNYLKWLFFCVYEGTWDKYSHQISAIRFNQYVINVMLKNRALLHNNNNNNNNNNIHLRRKIQSPRKFHCTHQCIITLNHVNRCTVILKDVPRTTLLNMPHVF